MHVKTLGTISPGVVMAGALIAAGIASPPTGARARAKLPAPTIAHVQPNTNAILECPQDGPGYSFEVRQDGVQLHATRADRGEIHFARKAIVWTFANGATFTNDGRRAIDVKFWCVP